MKDLTGLKIGNLTVLSYSHKHTQPGGAKVHYWNVLCDCGKEFLRRTNHLTSSIYKTYSCGCLIPKLTSERFKTHGYREHPLYGTWSKMIQRCKDPKDRFWKSYGGKGVKVCERWLVIDNFILDMGNKPSKYHSLDRINNDGDYCPENCRWSTPLEQARNKTNNNWITINGETKCLVDWCKLNNISPSRACARIRTGWDKARAVTTPKTHKSKTKIYR